MSSTAGQIDKSISGNLINKFGKNLPIPFIESVNVKDNGLEVTLSMYYSVTNEQLKNPERFHRSIVEMDFSVYFMLLIESNSTSTVSANKIYDYSRFLKNLNKNTDDSHIINYLSAFYQASNDTYLKPEFGFKYSSFGHPITGVSFLYPSEKWRSYMSGLPFSSFATTTSAAYINTAAKFSSSDKLLEKVQTNAYEIPIRAFKRSEMVYSREGEPIFKFTATRQIGTSTVNKEILTAILSDNESVDTELIVYDNEGIRPNNFFGTLNHLTHGINKMGLASFSTLFKGLESGFSRSKGIQRAFRSDSSKVKFYKSFVSDISHVGIMEKGKVLLSDTVIFEDISKNLVEATDVIRSINSEFYANDKIKLSEILEGLKELIVKTPDNAEAQTLIDSLSYILSEFGNNMNLLPELNKFRSQIPNRPTTTQEGKFYENVKIKIYNANQVVMQGRKLKRIIIKNPIVKDLRDPMIAADKYRPRTDVIVKYRQAGQDLSTKFNSLERARVSDPSNDFVPFIYLHGHEIQGQVNLDPTYNPMSVPASFNMPPYFASTETDSMTFMGSTAYENIIKTIQDYYLYAAPYGYASTDPRLSETEDSEFYNAKFDSFEGFAGAEIAGINEFIKEMTGYTNFVEDAYINLEAGNYNISAFRLESSERNTAANNNFTLIENGHFSFDYEKALGLCSNISLGLNTNKIDLLFGRDFLQSRYKVKRVRVDVHAKLVSTGQKPEYSVLEESNYSTYDGSPVYIPELEDAKIPHSHLNLGSIVAEFQDVESGNPVTTNCIVRRPGYFNNLDNYVAKVNERMGGFADDSDSLGKYLDYSLHKNFVKNEILTGYTIGKPGFGAPLAYNTYYRQAVLTDEEWDNTLFDLVVNDQYVKIEKTHSYIALRNIGSIYNTGGNTSLIRQYSHTNGGPFAMLTDNTGKNAAISLAAGYINIETFAELGAYFARNQAYFTPLENAATAPDYRLMTFEFQKVGLIEENVLATKDGLGQGGFANLMAFRVGVLPEQVEQYINRQFYEFYVEVEDTTYGAFKFLLEDYERYMKKFYEYLQACLSNCSYNDLTNSFNDFFVTGIEAEYADSPELAPWIRMPLLFCMHQEILFNAFNGDLMLLKDHALSLSEQVSPRTGNLQSVDNFYKKVKLMFDKYYERTTGLVTSRIEGYKGPSKMKFGRSAEPGVDDTRTSGYTMMGSPYTYNGYSATYQFDLHDSFNWKVVDVGDYMTTPAGSFGDIMEFGATAGGRSSGTQYVIERT